MAAHRNHRAAHRPLQLRELSKEIPSAIANAPSAATALDGGAQGGAGGDDTRTPAQLQEQVASLSVELTKVRGWSCVADPPLGS